MRFKLDENLGERQAQRLREAGHDVTTVVGQKMSGASDDQVYEVCVAERRALVTLDADFSNPFRFAPAGTAGIAVLRVPPRPTRDDLDAVLARLVEALAVRDLNGHLWAVDHRCVREYRPGGSEGND